MIREANVGSLEGDVSLVSNDRTDVSRSLKEWIYRPTRVQRVVSVKVTHVLYIPSLLVSGV